jgi:hypothetical protein
VEILESYCKTCVIAQQIGKPLHQIPDQKIQEILTLKSRLGFPDARMAPLPPVGDVSASSPEVDRHFQQVVSSLEHRS